MTKKSVANATLPTLYSRDLLGNVRQWKVWAEGPYIKTAYGVVGGEIQTTSKKAKPKNVGRANETSAEEQAIKEAQALFIKKQDQEYTTDPSGSKFILRPMLAHLYRQQDVRYPCYGDYKYDGIRCFAYWDGDRVIIESRKGKEFFLPHLSEELQKILPRECVLDGELYKDGVKFQTITKWVKDVNNTDRTKICINYYDCFLPESPLATQAERLAYLRNLPESHLILPAPHKTLNSFDEAMQLFAESIACGYEGIMFRNADGVYELDQRSHNLLKYKEFEDAEFKIVSFDEAEGRDAGTVVWICACEAGTFRVRPRGTLAERRDWFSHVDKYIGKQLTVRFQGLTDEGKPRFPVGICIRDYE